MNLGPWGSFPDPRTRLRQRDDRVGLCSRRSRRAWRVRGLGLGLAGDNWHCQASMAGCSITFRSCWILLLHIVGLVLVKWVLDEALAGDNYLMDGNMANLLLAAI